MIDGTNRAPTDAQMTELASHTHGAVASALYALRQQLSFADIQLLLQSGAELRALVRLSVIEALLPGTHHRGIQSTFLAERRLWMQFYRQEYQDDAEEIARIWVPPYPDVPPEQEFVLVFVLRGMTTDTARCRFGDSIRAKRLGEGVYANSRVSDSRTSNHARLAHQGYAVWVERNPFGPDVNYGKSAEALDPEHTRGVTLLEEFLTLHYQLHIGRALFQMHTGKSVLCTGSWSSNIAREIPFVGFKGDGSCVAYVVCASEVKPDMTIRRVFA
jgi:hypothetical protein